MSRRENGMKRPHELKYGGGIPPSNNTKKDLVRCTQCGKVWTNIPRALVADEPCPSSV